MEILVLRLSVSEDTGTVATNKITFGKLHWYSDTIFLIGCSDGTVRFYNVEQAQASIDAEYPPALHILSTTTDNAKNTS